VCVCVCIKETWTQWGGGGGTEGEETNLSLGIKFLEKICFFERLELSLLKHAVTLGHTHGFCLALFQIPCFSTFSLFDNNTISPCVYASL